ncbi:hypothetical protein GpartN1_g883.t1 [Galdieria partita]|uniref:Methyltransferase type 11 domain-containing protein n=1 Tax=Galdieria partita TaxID=83374 RepID=A0A9C7PSC8_9RHOD|nr:hypothetical protein GpartN1_g883.t1 [Galdieria partita]
MDTCGAFVSGDWLQIRRLCYSKQCVSVRKWLLNKTFLHCKHITDDHMVTVVNKKSMVEKLANWLVETPLIVPLWLGARQLMTNTAESLGIQWREEVRKLVGSRTDWEELLKQVCNENVYLPDYYSTRKSFYKGGVSFHGYPAGNLCWEAAFEQHLASKAVGARNFEEAGILGEQIFRGKYSTFLSQHLPASQMHNILDVGCGTGTSSMDLQQLFPYAKVTGIDLSPYMIAVAKQRFSSSDIDFLHCLAESTQMKDQSFDLVSLCLFIHELPYRATRDVFCEAYRILRKNGYLAIFEMDPSWEGNWKLRQMPVLFTLMRSTEPYLEEYFYQVAPCWKQLLEDSGLQLMDMQRGLSKRGHLALIAQKK